MPTLVTRYLKELSAGDRTAAEALLPIVYEDLRRLAARLFFRERSDHTLEPTALVHEAYLSLVDRGEATWDDQAHFYRVAAIAMRHILINHARDRGRLKRGGKGCRLALDPEQRGDDVDNTVDLLALDEALKRLALVDERKVQILELRYFGGFSVEKCSEILGVSPATVKRDWAFAKAWLARELA